MEKTRCLAKSRRGVKMIMMIMYTKLQVFLGSDDAEFFGINCINVMYQHLQIWPKDVAKSRHQRLKELLAARRHDLHGLTSII